MKLCWSHGARACATWHHRLYAAWHNFLDRYLSEPTPARSHRRSLPPRSCSLGRGAVYQRQGRDSAVATRWRIAMRIPAVTDRDQVPEDQRAVWDAIVASRGSVRGPFALLMHSPE